MGGEGAELGVEVGGGYINDITIDMKCDGIKYAEIRNRSLCNTPGQQQEYTHPFASSQKSAFRLLAAESHDLNKQTNKHTNVRMTK